MKELIDRKLLIDALRKDIQEYKDTDGQSIPFKTGIIYRQVGRYEKEGVIWI